ncbi:hypothetical protein K432DRAFT_288130 [Lepidopterella palustris CBS 459.81]|uniref:RRM domain-containing protein n=1 Tax=Lepidopterella palustris CBS 459.81 TaxID=1314670 RepID=A0A8E2EJ59_9PEZI|nr:hypothetical protein K432DRAFT_288130 [Lepidopterella palustris CBS 459.81]
MRIDQGLDVRTTIMLRNIPNKMDAIGLKDFIDNVGECKGMYDFIYLRIDFRTGSNVGYAFINFVCSKGMINMIRLIEGRPWEGYRSSKSAEISYATIQGTEALIQKFRNSSVMQEFPHCRPKQFHAFAGKEKPFPPPDNYAKLQRSVENAKHQGMFPLLWRGHTSVH